MSWFSKLGWFKKWSSESQPRSYNESDNDDILITTDYKATRVFEAEEDDDEGSTFFIEVDNGAVLFLQGQYLYDIPIDEFPCTEFTVITSANYGYVSVGNISCRGQFLPCEPESSTTVEQKDFEDGFASDDGTILPGITYDQVRERMYSRRKPGSRIRPSTRQQMANDGFYDD